MSDVRSITVAGPAGAAFVAELAKLAGVEGAVRLASDGFDAERFLVRADSGAPVAQTRDFTWTLFAADAPLATVTMKAADAADATPLPSAKDFLDSFPEIAAAKSAAATAPEIDAYRVGPGTKLCLLAVFALPLAGFVWMCIRFKWI